MKTYLAKLSFVAFVLIFSCTGLKPLRAGDVPAAIQEKINVFFQQLQAGQVQPAIQKVIEGGAIGKNPVQVQNLVNQTNNAILTYGAFQGSSYVNSTIVADTLCKVIFLSKHTNYPLRWTFIFYKTTDWTLVNIEFDDNVEALMS